MKNPDIPKNEKERLKALQDYKILDTLPEQDFDDITKIASTIFDTPISLISLIDRDRQWFKSRQGVEISETSRTNAFCAHAINDPENIFVVKNANKDERFADNPLVVNEPKVSYYAGVPLVTSQGMALGTLCIVDNKPRNISPAQLETLKALANQVMNLLELRKQNRNLLKVQKELNQRNADLEQFTRTASHDIKSPLGNIMALAQAIIETQSDKLDESGIKYLNYISKSATKLKNLVDGLLNYYSGDRIDRFEKETFSFDAFINSISDLLTIDNSVAINIKPPGIHLHANQSAMEQIFINLINNAIKYNNKEQTVIEIDTSESDGLYHFAIKDNGIGISDDKKEMVFKLFSNLGQKDRNGNLGTGLGLVTVKKIIEKLGGQITFESVPNAYTLFEFTIKK